MLEKLKIALKSINKAAKYFETKDFRELIEPYLKLQSRLQSLVNSLEFNQLDKELPFSNKNNSSTTTTAGASSAAGASNAGAGASSSTTAREAQIAADREFALMMSKSLNPDQQQPAGTSNATRKVPPCPS